MSFEIYTRTPNQVYQYRVRKAICGVILLPVGLVALAMEHPEPTAKVEETRPKIIRPRPVVATDEAMRSNFPIWWAKGGRAKLRKVGKHSMFGVGPANSEVKLYEEDELITRSRTNERGKWKAQIHIKEPGAKSYRADFLRDGIAAGKSAPLPITLVDPKQKGDGSDVSITNLLPNDRVIAGFFTLRGSAPPGDWVQIYVDSTLLGRAEVDLAGRWSFKPKINGGGRRTFTIIDEITQRQFGPLPVFIAGKKGAPKPKVPVAAQGTPLR